MADEKGKTYHISCGGVIQNYHTGEQATEVIGPERKEREVTIGIAIGGILGEEKHAAFRPARASLLSEKFFTQESVELDRDDMDNLLKAVDESERWLPFVTGQVAAYLNGVKTSVKGEKVDV